jgi:hypothetical protein
MIITTSSFTAGAAGNAVDLGFELIDGVRFAKLLLAGKAALTRVDDGCDRRYRQNH